MDKPKTFAKLKMASTDWVTGAISEDTYKSQTEQTVAEHVAWVLTEIGKILDRNKCPVEAMLLRDLALAYKHPNDLSVTDQMELVKRKKALGFHD